MPNDTLYTTIDPPGKELPPPGNDVRTSTGTSTDTTTDPSLRPDLDNPIVIGTILIVLLAPLFAKLFQALIRRKKWRKDLRTNSRSYHEHLLEHIHYYRQLPLEEQVRFLKRVTVFMHAREFRYMNIEQQERMPILISAAAVQLTFGLNEFLLDHFKVIYVLKEDYRYGHYNMPFMGHVDHSGIYLSWNNFLRGFQNYNDAHNVGIHEMAHALAYVNFMSDSGHDTHFRGQFRDFSKIARPIFNRMQHGEQFLLDPYAATNYNEFWAVSVETFFEKPMQMRSEMPDLYEAMCQLLNQDPLAWKALS
ncbi:MAG: zinc-dependent peptidase [Chitinophagaceae bacterium]